MYKYFLSSLKEKFVEQKDCDVKFIFYGNLFGESISAHKRILSIASDVFDTMFYGATSKSDILLNANIVEIKDIQLSTFKLFLSFIYQIKINFENLEMVQGFHYAAHMYQCKDALEFVLKHMMQILKPENSFLFYDIASLYEHRELGEACLKLFSDKTLDVIKSKEFLSAKPQTVETIFKLDPLNINSERDLVQALQRYIVKNQETDPEIATKVRLALKCIRFLTLTEQDIRFSSLLTFEEKKCLIACLPPKLDMSKMLKGFSKKTHKRHFNEEVYKMIRSLTDIFSAKMCYHCARRLGVSTCLHAIWNCEQIEKIQQNSMSRIYEKYNHTSLMEYEASDIKAVYDFFNSCGLIKEEIKLSLNPLFYEIFTKTQKK